jgi:tetratricopeptide (TPR) repeat protein
MIRAATPRGPAGAVPGRSSWPVRSGTVPALADGYTDRLETGPDLAAALPAGVAVALVPDRVAGPGPAADLAAQDWLRASGKTQLAAAFAESLWRSGGLDLLVWIQATSRAAVLSGYAAATATATGRDQAISCESVAAQFLSWLDETSHSWLVVLDDLADPADLDGLWPTGPTGRVLVTCADAAAVPRGMRILPVGLFNSREALSYLMGRLSANPAQRLGAIDLVSDMALEPTALTQASAVLASTSLSCHNYHESFVRRRQQLTDSSGAPPSASAVTWTLSWERADQLAPGGSVPSLLALAALLDGAGIPGTVLTAPAAAGYLASGGRSRAGGDGARTALAAMERVALLTITTATAPPTVQVSPVLQAALRAAMPDGLLDQAARVAADALLQAWPEPELPGWPASGLRSCTAALRQIAGNRLWADGCHPVLHRAGDSLDHALLTGPAVDHWRDLVRTSDQLLGAGHPHTILAGQRLAEALLAAGRPEDAVSWFQRLIDTLVVQLGPDHDDVIGAWLRLGHALVAAGQPQRAISVFERVLPDFEQVRGPEQAGTLGARDELAAAYLAAGRPSDAIAVYRRALADRERTQGSRHPQTMTTRHGLADSYLASGLVKEAVAAYKRVVADRERALGPDHLDTIRARYSLGAAYQRSGKTVAAERAYEQARIGFDLVLGPRHPDALRSRAELAQVYRQLGRYGDARALLLGTVDRLEQILPPGDPLITEMREILTDIGDELSRYRVDAVVARCTLPREEPWSARPVRAARRSGRKYGRPGTSWCPRPGGPGTRRRPPRLRLSPPRDSRSGLRVHADNGDMPTAVRADHSRARRP